jgi:hypothetical protein
MRKTYHESCHRDAARFECDLDLTPPGQRSEPRRPGVWWTSTFRCNCSFRFKMRFWKASATPDDFRLTEGCDALCDYQFGHWATHHFFCRHWGGFPFASSSFDLMGGDFHAINIASLDDASLGELAQAPIIYEHGGNDAWDQAPGRTTDL